MAGIGRSCVRAGRAVVPSPVASYVLAVVPDGAVVGRVVGTAASSSGRAAATAIRNGYVMVLCNGFGAELF